jgi:hypothetical protein
VVSALTNGRFVPIAALLKALSNGSFWPYSDSAAANLSVSFEEIVWLFWGKFLNLGFSRIHRQLFL